MFLACAVATHTRGTVDVIDSWLPWVDKVLSAGLVKGYQEVNDDYPPLTVATMAAAVALGEQGPPAARLAESPTKVQIHLGGRDYVDPIFSIKLSLAIALLLTLFVFWWATRDYWGAMLMFAALFLNTVIDGYLDIYYAPLLLAAIEAFRAGRWGWFSLLFALACMFKWPPAIIGPFFAIHIIRAICQEMPDMKSRLQRLAAVAAPGAAVFGLILLVFGAAPIFHAIHLTLISKHHIYSGNALNFPWVIAYVQQALGQIPGLPLTEGESTVLALPKSAIAVMCIRLPFYAGFLTLLWRAWRQQRQTFVTTIQYALAGYLTYFMFNTGVHENHLFVAVLLALYLSAISRAPIEFTVWLIVMLNLNLYLFYGGDGTTLHHITRIRVPRTFFGHVDTTIIASVFNCAIYAFWAWPLLVGRGPGETASSGAAQ